MEKIKPDFTAGKFELENTSKLSVKSINKVGKKSFLKLKTKILVLKIRPP